MTNVSELTTTIKKIDDVNLGKVSKAFSKGKLFIFITTIVFTASAAFISLRLPNMYTSEVVLIPSGERAASKLPGQLSGLAALAGVNLGGSGDKSALAIEILKSKEFIANFIEQKKLGPTIFAAENWDRNSNTIIFDPKIYDSIQNKWVREAEAPFKAEPSRLELVNEFSKYFNITTEKTTGIVKLTMKHYSPYVAKDVLDSLVIEINENLRSRDLKESQLSISFLRDEIQKTDLSDIKSMLYSLVEEQTKNIMIANTRKEYVFKIIDPAVVPEIKSEPKRAVIVLVGIVLGILFGTLISIRRYYNS